MKKVIKGSDIPKIEARKAAQDLIMQQLSIIGYGGEFEDFVEKVGDQEEATAILFSQMNRVAKLFGYSSAWFS